MQTKAAALNSFNKFRISFRETKDEDLKYQPFSNDYVESANEILGGILVSEYKYLLPHLQSVSLRAGQELFAEGEKNEYVYFPETCVVSHLYNLADGSTIEVAMIGREGISDLCSLFGSHINSHQARVTIGGTARRIKTKILSQALSNGGKLQNILLDYFTIYLNQVSQRVICQSFHALEKRLCSWLLMTCDRTRNQRLAITHEQISLILGVHRPTLSIIAKNLREAGLIRYSRGNLEISNRRGLERSACECYSAAQVYC